MFTGYGEALGVKEFLFSQSVTFNEAAIMKKHTNHEVHHLNENSKNELTFPSDSQIVNYGDPITRDQSRRLQQNQFHGKGNQYNKFM